MDGFRSSFVRGEGIDKVRWSIPPVHKEAAEKWLAHHLTEDRDRLGGRGIGEIRLCLMIDDRPQTRSDGPW